MRIKKGIIVPIVLLLLMLIDGHISNVVSSWWDKLSVTSLLLFTSFIFMIDYYKKQWQGLLIAMILGLIYDAYYLGILGVAFVLFPLILLFMYNIRHVATANWVTRYSTYIIITNVFIVMSWLVSIFVLGNEADPIKFIVFTLAPSIVLNSILFSVIYIPNRIFFTERSQKSDRRR
jgi:rod shape-determining protein MreD